jgi:hypothetical protein
MCLARKAAVLWLYCNYHLKQLKNDKDNFSG